MHPLCRMNARGHAVETGRILPVREPRYSAWPRRRTSRRVSPPRYRARAPRRWVSKGFLASARCGPMDSCVFNPTQQFDRLFFEVGSTLKRTRGDLLPPRKIPQPEEKNFRSDYNGAYLTKPTSHPGPRAGILQRRRHRKIPAFAAVRRIGMTLSSKCHCGQTLTRTMPCPRLTWSRK